MFKRNNSWLFCEVCFGGLKVKEMFFRHLKFVYVISSDAININFRPSVCPSVRQVYGGNVIFSAPN